MTKHINTTKIANSLKTVSSIWKKHNKLVPSTWATTQKDAGFEIITWTVDRGYKCWGPRPEGHADSPECQWNEFELIDAMADMGVVGIFSDWPATTTFYANCKMPKGTPCHPHQGCKGGLSVRLARLHPCSHCALFCIALRMTSGK